MGIPKYHCIPSLSPQKLLLSLSDLTWLEPEWWGSQKLLVSWKGQGTQAGFLLFLAVFAEGGDSALGKCFCLLSAKLEPVPWTIYPPMWEQHAGFCTPEINAVCSTSAQTPLESLQAGFFSAAKPFPFICVNCKVQKTDRNSFLHPCLYHREKKC